MLLTTASGRSIDVLCVRQDDLHILDIAHGLSNLCRFGGHTRKFYSVAQHSIRVAMALPDHLKFVGLMHDAAEAYVLDMPTPLKRRMPHYRAFERSVWKALCEKYALPEDIPEAVKYVDEMAAASEYEELLPAGAPGAPTFKTTERLSFMPPMAPGIARDTFLAMFSVYSKAPR